MREGGEPASFDWAALVPHSIHTIKVEIVEALRYLEQPLSASDLEKVLGGRFSLSRISYHVTKLAAANAILEVERRPLCGSTERLYALR